MVRTADTIASEYRQALRDDANDAARHLLQEEAALVLLDILGHLSDDRSSFVHEVALKGGALMLGELGSPRFSSDLDFTRGYRASGVDPDSMTDEIERCGRAYAFRVIDVQRNRYSVVLMLTYQSRCTGSRQPSKVEVSLREDPVAAVRQAEIDPTRWGLAPFSVNALDPHDLVAEKLRTLYQRAQPRDLYDTWFYLHKSGFHLDPLTLRLALDAKFKVTRIGKYRDGAWCEHLDEIAGVWDVTLSAVLDRSDILVMDDAVNAIASRLAALRIR